MKRGVDGLEQSRRQVGPDRLEERRARPDPASRAGGVARAERVPAGESLPEDHADGPDVGGGGRLVPVEALGGDVGERAGHVSDRGQRVELGHLREAEVEQADVDLVRLAEQDVRRLHVAVDDAAAVGVRERVEQLRGGLDRLAVAELAGGERLAEGAAGHVLVGDVDVAGVARKRIDALAAGVAQRGGGARLALGPLGDPALPDHHLERDVEAVALVPGEPDMTHPTRAQRA